MFVRKMLTGLAIATATVAPVAVVNVAPAHAASATRTYLGTSWSPSATVVQSSPDTVTVVNGTGSMVTFVSNSTVPAEVVRPIPTGQSRTYTFAGLPGTYTITPVAPLPVPLTVVRT